MEVFSDMENIMTHVLKESDDLPPKLLAPILHYVNETDEVMHPSIHSFLVLFQQPIYACIFCF